MPLSSVGEGTLAFDLHGASAPVEGARIVVGRGTRADDGAPCRVPVPDPGLALHLLLSALDRLAPDPGWCLPEEIGERGIPPVPNLTIHRTAQIGGGSRMGPGVVIGPSVRIGEGCVLDSGCVIGFNGFRPRPDGRGGFRDTPHLGGVSIGADVRLGPLCTVASGLLQPTEISDGCRLDAKVHVGHHARIGKNCVVAAGTGFAGGVVLGCFCLVGGHAAFAEGVCVGEGSKIAALAGVTRCWPAGSVLAGFPARPAREHWRSLASRRNPSGKMGDR